VSVRINGKPTAFEAGSTKSYVETMRIVEAGIRRELGMEIKADTDQRDRVAGLRMSREEVIRAGGSYPYRVRPPQPEPPKKVYTMSGPIEREEVSEWAKLREAGWKWVTIAEKVGRPPSSVRDAVLRYRMKQGGSK